MSWRCVPLPISLRLSSRSSAKMSLRNSSMIRSSRPGPAARCSQDGVDDRFVAGATADVSGDRLDNFGVARGGVAVEQRFCGHQHARRAIAALRGEMFCKGALERMQCRALLQAVERFDSATCRGLRECQTREMEFAVDQHAARTAAALAAAEF